MMFKPRDLANTVWAFAKAGLYAPERFEAVAAAIAASSRISTTLGPQELADTAWAFATARVEAWPLFDAIAKATAPIIDDDFTLVNMSEMHQVYVHLAVRGGPSSIEGRRGRSGACCANATGQTAS